MGKAVPVLENDVNEILEACREFVNSEYIKFFLELNPPSAGHIEVILKCLVDIIFKKVKMPQVVQLGFIEKLKYEKLKEFDISSSQIIKIVNEEGKTH